MSLKMEDYVKTEQDGTKTVQEGKAKIIYDDNVFYNPIQEFNRDMSIAAISAWKYMTLDDKKATAAEPPVVGVEGEDKKTKKLRDTLKCMLKLANKTEFKRLEDPDFKFTILEALAATGLRSMRYAKEIKNVHKILANDLLPEAVQSIQRNAVLNKVDNTVQGVQGDAVHTIYKAIIDKQKYDVIDLDPYGSAAPFLDASIQAVSDGGLLCVTCTDMAVLAGSQPEACWAKYGGINLPNSSFTHEMALRILLHSIQTIASRYKRVIEPLASFSIDYYIRVFVRVKDSASAVKEAASKTGVIYNCNGCKSFHIQPMGKYEVNPKGYKGGPARGPPVGPNCEHCGFTFQVAGPLYIAPIHHQEFLSRMLEYVAVNHDQFGTFHRMAGMLCIAKEELPVPLYYVLSSLSNTLHCTSPSYLQMIAAITKQGFAASQSHACPQALKTTAPIDVLWDIMRSWVDQHDKSKKEPKDPQSQSPSTIILSKEAKVPADFTDPNQHMPDSIKYKLVRFQMNPAPNWGPMSRPNKRKAQEQ
ncbi:N2,N2-dimethylguanosine tRNA methyltransferase [Gorgonomyces haynaldii]|nr:N2,N2-dimethylguanosine tRNA methyltransferase [Gorgonomyces haynaldii]